VFFEELFMPYDALEIVKHRNNFYRDSYRKVLFSLLIAMFLIVALAVTVFVLIIERPSPTYFATTDSGRIIPLIPLDRPNLSSQDVLQWASEAVIAVNSYDFVNFRSAFQASEKYFTSPGWDSFMKALSTSKNLETVQNKKIVVSAVLSGAPIITNRYVIHGRYTWKLQLPMVVSYQSQSETIDQHYLVLLTVERVSTLDNVYGVGISSYVAELQ